VDWGGTGVEAAPYEIPPVFADGRVLVFGRIEKPGKRTVELRATGPQGKVSFSLAVDPSSAAEGTLVGTLWARRAIRDLEEGRSALHPRRGSRQKRALGNEAERVKAEVVRLGTTWSLVSRYTSFVAVEERETPTEGDAQLRRIPVAITRGWHGLSQVMARMSLDAATALERPKALSGSYLEEPLESGFTPSRDAQRNMSGRRQKVFRVGHRGKDDTGWSLPTRALPEASAPVAGTGPAQATRAVDRVVWLQAADGAWALTDELAKALGWRDAKHLRGSLGTLRSRQEERAAATALALAWLEREATDTRDEWRILADKGREWLAKMPEGAEHWLERGRAAWPHRA
jgi:hypothetical protein